jgi:hypothetical protein
MIEKKYCVGQPDSLKSGTQMIAMYLKKIIEQPDDPR